MVIDMSRIKTMLRILPATLLVFALGAGAAEFEKGEDGGILIPPNAEMLLYSGSINFAMPEGCGFRDAGKAECPSGDMEAQGTAILEGFKNRLEARGWSMENVVRVNVYGVAGEDGLDFSGFNTAFAKYFSREDGGWYPARTFVEVAALFRPELLVEVEILAMKARD
jgi:enamine deaminase RidA (YjgF/YER057c/UK114 family)